MKHKFTITYETDGLPICPDAIHKQLATAVVEMKKEFAMKYYKLPGLHKLYLEPCGDWFPEEQKPMRFKVSSGQARKLQAREDIIYEENEKLLDKSGQARKRTSLTGLKQ